MTTTPELRTPTAPPSTPWRLDRVAGLVCILALAVFLRSWEWTGRGIWFDEAFTWRLVGFSPAEMMERAARDNSPPLYYLVLQPWTWSFGTSLAALRGLSVLFGVLAVVGMYLFVREAFRGRESGRGLALFVAALVATSALQVRYSGEVRAYALGAALAAFSAWTLARATRPGESSVRRWAVYGVVALAFAYTHYYALFVIAGQAVYVAGWLLAGSGWRVGAAVRRPAFRHALLAGAVIAVGYLPWVPTFLRQQAQVRADFWAAPVNPWTVPELCYQMLIDPEAAPVPGFSHRRLAAATALCALGVVVLAWRARGADWHVLLAGASPVVLAVVAAELGTRTITLRYFVFAHLFLLAGVGAVVWRINRAPVRVGVAALLVVGNVAVTGKFLREMRLPDRPGSRGAADYIAARRGADEPVVVASPLWYFALAYHLDDRGVRVYDSGGPIPHYLGTAALRPGDRIDRRELETAAGRRVWVVCGKGGWWGKLEVPPPPGWVLVEEHSFPEALRVGTAVVRLYERPDAETTRARAASPAD